jgi:hypothetical protein
VTEELVSAVDQVNDHFGSMLDRKYGAEQKISEERALQAGIEQKAKEFADHGSKVCAKA